jgi:hypothetical protein
MKPDSLSSIDIILQNFKNQGRFGLVESRDAEGGEVERLRKSNTPQSLLYNTDTSEDLPFQDNLNPGFFWDKAIKGIRKLIIYLCCL